jgi:hypothetical protein
MRIDWSKPYRDYVENGEKHVGDIRERSAYLFVPKTIDGETRWLEDAKWKERWDRGYWELFTVITYNWKPFYWIG